MNNYKKIITLRTFHVIGALFLYFCAGFLIYAGITNYRGVFLYFAIGSLALELLLVSINNWDCPLHPLHKKLGDDKAFFGLFMPIRYTKKAMNISIVLGFFSVGFWSLGKLIN